MTTNQVASESSPAWKPRFTTMGSRRLEEPEELLGKWKTAPLCLWHREYPTASWKLEQKVKLESCPPGNPCSDDGLLGYKRCGLASPCVQEGIQALLKPAVYRIKEKRLHFERRGTVNGLLRKHGAKVWEVGVTWAERNLKGRVSRWKTLFSICQSVCFLRGPWQLVLQHYCCGHVHWCRMSPPQLCPGVHLGPLRGLETAVRFRPLEIKAHSIRVE